eukprot:CAMPEP_0119333666 /NCGR_PEP_ID=MMETSP1333-20130426/85714_1 /TAXON_ID=418940 /ORGANISM="Scyphosphaera apsteinii, Strain RCC1455" /LENGTH=68 /DNA_ID=CAMNT_0007343795 /DNA_START=591 /DNA_END=797 /DNA_ORIENTATION=+
MTINVNCQIRVLRMPVEAVLWPCENGFTIELDEHAMKPTSDQISRLVKVRDEANLLEAVGHVSILLGA